MNEEKHSAILDMQQEKEPSSLRLILALGIAGLLSGVILVSTFLYTDPLIKANKAAAVQRAIFNVLPECESFTTLTLENGKLHEKKADEDGNKEESASDELLVYSGFDSSGDLIGFAVPGSEPGFQDVISTIFGYDAADQVIIGFEVLESKETPGLGDKIFKDADFQLNFSGLATYPEIMAVKKGERQNQNEVETITGATISSKAIVRSLNNSMETWRDVIDDYMKENYNSLTDE